MLKFEFFEDRFGFLRLQGFQKYIIMFVQNIVFESSRNALCWSFNEINICMYVGTILPPISPPYFRGFTVIMYLDIRMILMGSSKLPSNSLFLPMWKHFHILQYCNYVAIVFQNYGIIFLDTIFIFITHWENYRGKEFQIWRPF